MNAAWPLDAHRAGQLAKPRQAAQQRRFASGVRTDEGRTRGLCLIWHHRDAGRDADGRQ
jgi:hypothetical protein